MTESWQLEVWGTDMVLSWAAQYHNCIDMLLIALAMRSEEVRKKCPSTKPHGGISISLPAVCPGTARAAAIPSVRV